MDGMAKVLLLWTIVLITYQQHSASCFVESAPRGKGSIRKPATSSEYKGETVRRQQVIHPLDDDDDSDNDAKSVADKTTSASSKSKVPDMEDDDIEKFGKTMDATGAVINNPLSTLLKHDKDSSTAMTAASSKAIIAKIKEIQDKIFKRTSLSNNKELEDRLRLMSPSSGSIASSSSSSNLPAQKRIELDGGVTMATMLKPKQPVDVQGDRRKIIPEDVVDKILEKFQQLRTEAKHIALASPDEQAKKAGKVPDKVTVKEIPADLTDGSVENKTPPNPYASIGPPKESSEFANRTNNINEVTSFGMTADGRSQTQNTPSSPGAIQSSNGEIQIPIGNAANAAAPGGAPISTMPSADGKTPNGAGVPIMFIKNGPNLIPVYKNGGQPSNTDNPSPGGVSTQMMPQMQYQPEQQQQQQQPFFSQPPNGPNTVIPMMESFSNNNNNNNNNNNEVNPARADSRCDVPGGPCADNVEEHIEPDRMTSDMRKTGELIDRLIHTPGFPQLASKLISEGKVNYDGGPNDGPGPDPGAIVGPTGPDTGDSRNVVPLSENTMDRVDHAQVNFDMKGSYATSNFPAPSANDPSMLREEEDRHRDEERHREDIEHFLEHQPRSKSDVSSINDDFHENAHGGHSPSGLDGRYVNDISDPAEQEIQSKFQSKSADELLDYAKFRSLSAPDLHAPPGSQFGSPPVENNFEPPPQQLQQRSYNDEESPGDRSIENRYMNEDPGTLLDDLHKSQMQNGLNGVGSPGGIESPTTATAANKMIDEEEQQAGDGRHRIPEPEPAPDDLLEQVRSFNHKMVAQQLQHRRRIEQEKKNLNGGGGFGQMDPSIADEITSDGGLAQRFDVQRKDLATENDMQLLKGRSTARAPANAVRGFGQMSVMSGDDVQFKNGRLSMDTNDVVSSFNEEGEYSRNTIGGKPHRRHRKHKRHHKNNKAFLHPYTRGSIEHPVAVDSDIELRVNGQTLTDNTQLRSTIVDGKVKPGKGKTFTSKEPVQIELSHGDDKRKIINIVTMGKYRVVNDKKRFNIPH